MSNLIAFYRALNPKLDVDALCRPVSADASRKVWNADGPVGKNKNRSFTPKFHPCEECTGTPKFPKEFQLIAPAKRGELFDAWIPPTSEP